MNRTALACLVAGALQFAPLRAQTYTISTIAGNSFAGYSGDGGPANQAQLYAPYGVSVTSSGAIFIADQTNQCIREIQNGNISTVAGNNVKGYLGDGGPAVNAELASPVSVAVDKSGNYYIADHDNSLVRKVTGTTITTYAGSATLGAGANGDGTAAVNAQLFLPAAVALDSAGNLYIADSYNNKIRKVDTSGNITTVAGTGYGAGLGFGGFAGDGLAAKSAQLNGPLGVAVDAAGNLYISDTGNNRIRKVTAGTNIITTIAGSTTGFGGDLGLATAAKLNRPIGIAVDAAGNLYIADSSNSRIRKVTPAGVIVTIAGNGRPAFTGDGGPATSASLNGPSGVAVDTSGNVYVADVQNNVIRLLTPPSTVGNPPAITGAGSASDYGIAAAVAPGTWMQIYGTSLAADTRLWTGADFSGAKAPTVLDNTSVYIAGQMAYVQYISGTQVNVQVPSTVSTGQQPVILTTATGMAGPYTVTVNPVQPGLLAPTSFNIGGKQYVVALFPDGVTYVLPPNAIPGLPSRQAHPGETITLYGIGFGTVNPNTPAGQIVPSSNALTAPLQILFGQTPASTSYAGLAPQEVGQYQFNVVVPSVPSNDAVPFSYSLNGTAGAQTLYTAVQD